MGEVRGKKDDVAKALGSIRQLVGSWSYTTIEAEVRRLRLLEEATVALGSTAAAEILRLVAILFEGHGGEGYDSTVWCDCDTRARPARLKVECLECLEAIIAGSRRAH